MSPQANAAAFADETGHVPTIVETPSTITPPAVSDAINASNQTAKFYTEDDLAKVRAQEKDKLYPQIDSLKEEVALLKREREDRAAKKQAEADAEAAEKAEKDRKKQEEELSAKELIAVREKELSQQQEELRQQLFTEKQEREKAFALLEQERMFSELQNYRAERLDAERDNIMPELLDMVSGNTPQEIDASISALTERTQRIIESVKQTAQDARQQMVGTRATLPSAGPLDIESGSRQFTAADIASMSMNEYAKHRQQLLSDRAQGRQSGLFG